MLQDTSMAWKILLSLAFLMVASCKHEDSKEIITQPAKIKAALQKFLEDEKRAISFDASFVYESDTLDRDVNNTEKGTLTIGRWEIKCSGSKAEAKISMQYGGGSGEFIDEVLEVQLELKDGSVTVADWNAYHQHYTELN